MLGLEAAGPQLGVRGPLLPRGAPVPPPQVGGRVSVPQRGAGYEAPGAARGQVTLGGVVLAFVIILLDNLPALDILV